MRLGIRASGPCVRRHTNYGKRFGNFQSGPRPVVEVILHGHSRKFYTAARKVSQGSQMPPPGGKRSSLASYTWGGFGSQNDLTQFRNVFQPDQGIFSPGYPLVPPEREGVRVWDFPVGYNTIYTPRSYEPIGFPELRALADKS